MRKMNWTYWLVAAAIVVVGGAALVFAETMTIKVEQRDGEQVEVALQWHDGYNENVLAFTNTVYNRDGGTHLSGFRASLTRTINAYAQSQNLLKNVKENFSGEDVREGLTAIMLWHGDDGVYEGGIVPGEPPEYPRPIEPSQSDDELFLDCWFSDETQKRINGTVARLGH